MIFFKVHLLIEENRSEAVSERFRQFKGRKTKDKKCLTEIRGSEFLLESGSGGGGGGIPIRVWAKFSKSFQL